MQNILKEVPEEINNCTSIINTIVTFCIGLAADVSFGKLATNMQAQAMTLMMGLMAKGTDVGVAFAAHDFYRMGQDAGGMMNTVLDLGRG